jgi:hypothetical protein
MYPKLGRLAAIPAACDVKGVLSYSVSAPVGTEFRSIAHCTAEIASFVVTGKTGTLFALLVGCGGASHSPFHLPAPSEKDIVATIAAAADWFEKHTKWAPLPLA